VKDKTGAGTSAGMLRSMAGGNPATPGAFQLKYYAPGVGNVRVGWGGPNEEEHEELVLTELTLLDDDAFADVRAKALEQEARAYDMSAAAYADTAPATQRPA
jgi:hypothetical protein